jgi:hypothetical protein
MSTASSHKETAMFRKLAFALAATAALGTASLAVSSTPAEAKKGGHHGHFHKGGGHFNKGGHFHKHHWHKGHHHWRAHRFYGPAFTGIYAGCHVKRWVPTPSGYYVLRWVNVCF